MLLGCLLGRGAPIRRPSRAETEEHLRIAHVCSIVEEWYITICIMSCTAHGPFIKLLFEGQGHARESVSQPQLDLLPDPWVRLGSECRPSHGDAHILDYPLDIRLALYHLDEVLNPSLDAHNACYTALRENNSVRGDSWAHMR